MPEFNGTGPLGEGPLTGRGRGRCRSKSKLNKKQGNHDTDINETEFGHLRNTCGRKECRRKNDRKRKWGN